MALITAMAPISGLIPPPAKRWGGCRARQRTSPPERGGWGAFPHIVPEALPPTPTFAALSIAEASLRRPLTTAAVGGLCLPTASRGEGGKPSES